MSGRWNHMCKGPVAGRSMEASGAETKPVQLGQREQGAQGGESGAGLLVTPGNPFFPQLLSQLS